MKHNNEYLMAGLIKCGKCGSHLISAHSAGRRLRKFFYYECGRSRQGLGCDYTRIPASGLDQAVIRYFKRAAESQDLILKAIGNAIRDAQITFEKLQAQINETDARIIELKHHVDQLLNLAIKNSISQGATYKTKMAEFEKEIITLDEELNKLKAQRSVAQMDASSGEFIYQNIRMVIEQIDTVPVDVQKSLLRMLVHSIVVYDETVEINMYIQPECLPATLAQLPLKDENPALITDQSEVLASAPSVSTGRQVWGE